MQIMRACLFVCAFVWVSHFCSLILSICSSTLSMLHIIASTSRGLTHKVYRLSFILRPLFFFLFFFLPRSKLLVAGVVSVKLWDHSCVLSFCTLRVIFSCANGSVQSQGTWKVYTTTAGHCVQLPSCHWQDGMVYQGHMLFICPDMLNQ